MEFLLTPGKIAFSNEEGRTVDIPLGYVANGYKTWLNCNPVHKYTVNSGPLYKRNTYYQAFFVHKFGLKMVHFS